MNYLKALQVATILGVSVATVWRWVAAGRLPAPMKLGPNTTRWKASDIEAWLDKSGETV